MRRQRTAWAGGNSAWRRSERNLRDMQRQVTAKEEGVAEGACASQCAHQDINAGLNT